MSKVLLFLLSTLFLFPLFGQNRLSLAQALKLGLENNYQLKAAQQKLIIANNNNNWGTAGRYPNLDFNINSSNGYINSKSPGFLLEQSSFNAGVIPSFDLNWTIFNRKKTKISKHQLAGLEEESANQVLATEEKIIQSIINAYYSVLIHQHQFQTLNQVLNLSRAKLDYQDVRIEYGQGGKNDQLQTMDAYLNDSINILRQERKVLAAFRNLNLSLGIEDLSQTYQLSDELNHSPKAYQYEELENALLVNNASLKSLRIKREISNYNTLLLERFKLPSINIGSGVSFDLTGTNGTQLIAFGGQPPSENDSKGTKKTFNYYLSINFNYNLFDGGNKKRKIENSKMEELIIQLNILEKKRFLQSQLKDIYEQYKDELKLYELTVRLTENARENMVLGEENFKAGLLSSFEYRSIQLAFLKASQTQLDTIFSIKNIELELMKLTGNLQQKFLN